MATFYLLLFLGSSRSSNYFKCATERAHVSYCALFFWMVKHFLLIKATASNKKLTQVLIKTEQSVFCPITMWALVNASEIQN